MKSIQGKNALLTGGSRGLGPYIAHALAEEGVNLALIARSEDGLIATAGELSQFEVTCKTYPADIIDEGSRAELLEKVKSDFGHIDLLINNAGMEWVSTYVGLTPDHIKTMIQTNLMAPMLLTRMVLPMMLEKGSGHIVTMSSLGGKKGSPYSATYAATKAGLIEWTRGLREELRKTGIGASVICPGFVAQAGMFAVYNKPAPKLTGETTPEKVSGAVMTAIKKDVGEIIVNPGPTFLMTLMDAIHPGIMAWLLRTFGVYEFYRQQALDNEAQMTRRNNA